MKIFSLFVSTLIIWSSPVVASELDDSVSKTYKESRQMYEDYRERIIEQNEFEEGFKDSNVGNNDDDYSVFAPNRTVSTESL